MCIGFYQFYQHPVVIVNPLDVSSSSLEYLVVLCLLTPGLSCCLHKVAHTPWSQMGVRNTLPLLKRKQMYFNYYSILLTSRKYPWRALLASYDVTPRDHFPQHQGHGVDVNLFEGLQVL